MPDRPNLPPLSIGSTRRQPARSDSVRRLALLDAAVLRWLRDAGWPQTDAASQTRALAPLLRQWLVDTHAELFFDRTPSLTDRLIRQLPPARLPVAAAFTTAFARSVMAQAVDEVALEAQRAGHADEFACLRSYLHNEPTPATLMDLATTLEMSQPALAIALSRLRHRLRQRIEAGLGLWAASPESRDTLRRQLRQSLIDTESMP